MSNPVSLYVEEESACLRELSDPDVVDCERTPNLRDYLKEADSDMYTLELSELYEAKGESLSEQPAGRIMNLILWSWIDESFKICEIDEEKAEVLGLELAISPATIQTLIVAINEFEPSDVAAALFAPNEVWDTEDELVEYLSYWAEAFSDALESGKGLYYKTWV